MQKFVIPILMAALLLLGGLFYFQGKRAERDKWEQKERERLHIEQISTIQAAAAKDRAAVERIRADRAKTDSIFTASISALKSKTAREHKKVTELRPQVDQLADSITVLGEFLRANDSLQASKDLTITKLEQQIDTLYRSHANEVTHLNNQIAQFQAGQIEQLNTIDGLQKSLAKAEKKASKRLGFGINGGYGIQEHGGTITAGPTISAGVHWTIFRL